MDKSAIFYFSQSGNSLDAARVIASQFNHTELISIPETLREGRLDFSGYTCAGFVVPLYFAGLPRTVEAFMKLVKLPDAKYAFAIITRAITKGKAIGDISKMLAIKGVGLNYGRYVTYPDSYIRWAEAVEPEKQKVIIDNARERLETIGRSVANGALSLEREGFFGKLVYTLAYKIWRSRLHKQGKRFKVNSECTHCGICSQSCPSCNIEMHEGRPVWSDHCEDCMACVQHCPEKAIYFNRRTPGKRRYINPNIHLNDLLDSRNRKAGVTGGRRNPCS